MILCHKIILFILKIPVEDKIEEADKKERLLDNLKRENEARASRTDFKSRYVHDINNY